MARRASSPLIGDVLLRDVQEADLPVFFKVTAPVGSFVVIPRGVVHQPSNPATEPTRVLLIFSPSGMEHFFEEAAEEHIPLQAVPTDPDVLEKRAAFTKKYGYEFADLP